MVYLQGEIKQYQEELAKDKNTEERTLVELRQREEKYSASVQALAGQIRQYETVQVRQQELVGETASARDRLVACERAIEAGRDEHQRLTSQKQELAEQVRAVKQRIRGFQATRSDKAGAIRAAGKENIKSINTNAEKGRKTGEEELKKIREEKGGVDGKLR